LLDPDTLIADVIGVNITEVVDNFVDTNLGLAGLKTVSIDYLGYMPIFDPFGSYFFYPDHCYPRGGTDPGEKGDNSGRFRYNSPIIGYVKTGSSVEEDVAN
jgi:hypothetical protein